MPRSRIVFGPFAAVYVGDFGSLNTLIRLASVRTKGTRFSYEVPEQFEPLLGNSIQSGEAKLQFDLTFYGTTDLNIMRLAMGNSVETAPAEDAPSSFAKYTVLLLHRSSTTSESFLIPECYTTKRLAPNYEKTAATEVPISFTMLNRNRFINLFHKGTLAALKAIPIHGARIP